MVQLWKTNMRLPSAHCTCGRDDGFKQAVRHGGLMNRQVSMEQPGRVKRPDGAPKDLGGTP